MLERNRWRVLGGSQAKSPKPLWPLIWSLRPRPSKTLRRLTHGMRDAESPWGRSFWVALMRVLKEFATHPRCIWLSTKAIAEDWCAAFRTRSSMSR